ncbi:MAG: hypothetical protein ABR573_03935 [Candidatus Dormibacteria bacterium]
MLAAARAGLLIRLKDAYRRRSLMALALIGVAYAALFPNIFRIAGGPAASRPQINAFMSPFVIGFGPVCLMLALATTAILTISEVDEEICCFTFAVSGAREGQALARYVATLIAVIAVVTPAIGLEAAGLIVVTAARVQTVFSLMVAIWLDAVLIGALAAAVGWLLGGALGAFCAAGYAGAITAFGSMLQSHASTWRPLTEVRAGANAVLPRMLSTSVASEYLTSVSGGHILSLLPGLPDEVRVGGAIIIGAVVAMLAARWREF